MDQIIKQDDGVQSPSLRRAFRLIGGTTLSTLLLSSCGDNDKNSAVPRDLQIERKPEIVDVDKLELENPFE